MIKKGLLKAFDTQTSKNKKKFLRQIFEIDQLKNKLSNGSIIQLFKDALHCKNNEMAQAFLTNDYLRKKLEESFIFEEFFLKAVSSGNTFVLQFFLKQEGIISQKIRKIALGYIFFMDLDTSNLVQTQEDFNSEASSEEMFEDMIDELDDVFLYAARYGENRVIDGILDDDVFRGCLSDETITQAFIEAVNNGHYDVFCKILQDKSCNLSDAFSELTDQLCALIEVRLHGDLALKYLVDEFDTIFLCAIRHGHEKIVSVFLNNDEFKKSVSTKKLIKKGFIEAVRNGQSVVVNEFVKHDIKDLFDQKAKHILYGYAMLNGNSDCINTVQAFLGETQVNLEWVEPTFVHARSCDDDMMVRKILTNDSWNQALSEQILNIVLD